MKTCFKLLLALCCFCTVTARAQQLSTYSHMDGMAVKEVKPEDVEGSPFLNDDWQQGALTTDKGQGFTDVMLKYDIHNDQLLFRGADGQPMAFADGVKTFTLGKAVYANGFPAVGAQGSRSYYQVLADGKVKLLKRTGKIIEETKSYGSTTSSRSFRKVEAYFIFKDDKMETFKPDKKSVTALLADKATQISAYADSHKINYKNDSDLGALFAYYNSLP